MAQIPHPSINTGEYKRIMVYSHDTFGLGNIRRMLSICEYLIKYIPNLSILLISGSPMLHSFRLPQGLDYIKLPCLNRGQAGKMAVKYLNADIESTLRLRSDLILAAAKNYQPDLVLVDKKPLGIQRELSSTISYLKNYVPKTKFVLLLRDILDTSQKTVAEWQREDYYRLLESVYDRLLAVGMPQIFDLCHEYQFGKAISDKVRYCGYIRKESGGQSQSAVRQELGVCSNEKLVLVTPGGGEDGYYLINNYLQGLKKNSNLFSRNKVRSLIFCGAEMPRQQQQKVHQQAANYPGVTVFEFTNDMISYINTADAVISMCGYNTITEVLQQGKKAIVVPRIAPGKEQLIRAQCLARVGLIEMIHPEKLEPSLLVETLFNSLDRRKSSEKIKGLDFSGLPRVTEYLSMLLFNSFGVREVTSIVLESA